MKKQRYSSKSYENGFIMNTRVAELMFRFLFFLLLKRAEEKRWETDTHAPVFLAFLRTDLKVTVSCMTSVTI